MSEFDVIVIGGGPAGSHAALSTASAGLRVALFDENVGDFGPTDPAGVRDVPADDARAGTVTRFMAHRVWGVTGEYRIDAVGPRGPVHCTARALIVATGSTVRIVPFEGWTLPGVISLETAATQIRSQGSLQGRSTLVAGCGPWLAAVAAATIEHGGRVPAIVDLADGAEWIRALRALSGHPDLRAQSLRWRRTIRRSGTPWHGRCKLVRVQPAGEGLLATLAPCDAAGRALDAPSITVSTDCVAVGYGSIPATEITGLLQARHSHCREAGGWIADADELGRTSRAGLYVAGDVTGVAGTEAAATHGTLVGLACALDLDAAAAAPLRGRIDAARRSVRRCVGVRSAMAHLMALWAAHVDGIAADTIVCRCESVNRAELDAACDAGARDMNQLKAWTRCGMGSCQGRLCGDMAGELLMRRTGAPSREAVGRFTPRMPLRPVTLDALTGSFGYDDIPIPAAAPL